MEIVNSQLIKRFVIYASIATLLISSIPLLFYAVNFSGNLSNSHSDWAAYGEFVGGTIGTIFSLVTVIFSIFSIYITLQIATRVHKNELEFNIQNREREIELTQRQNRPFPVLEFNRYTNKSEIRLSNEGPGTLIITDYQIICEGVQYRNFGHLVDDLIMSSYDKTFAAQFDSSAKLVLSAGSSKILFEINDENLTPEAFDRFNFECKSIIQNTSVILNYQDIFENNYQIEERLL